MVNARRLAGGKAVRRPGCMWKNWTPFRFNSGVARESVLQEFIHLADHLPCRLPAVCPVQAAAGKRDPGPI